MRTPILSISIVITLWGSASLTSAAETAGAEAPLARLRSGDEGQRIEAARSLGAMRSRPALRQLLICAQVDPAEAVRKACAAAVLAIDSRSFASKLASADPPPVAEPRYPLRPRARYATLFLLGLTDDTLRAAETLGGSAAFAIRWHDVEAQLTLGFPAMSLGLRARWLMIRYPRLTPYLSLGGVIAYNEDEAQRREAISVLGGVGLRFYFIPPIFIQLELSAAWALHAPLHRPRADGEIEDRRFSLPIMLELGLELWP